MLKGLYTAYTGMINEQHRMDTMTNNLANVSTVGFKKEGATSQAFGDILTVKIKDASMGSTLITQPLGYDNPGVKIGENYTDYTQGSFRITDNTYDLALAGDGFFAIEYKNKANETSTLYTRNGQFTLTSDGYLVTEDGDYVTDTQSRRIRLDPLLESTITSDGTIYQNGTAVARIRVVDVDNYDYLEKFGENLYRLREGGNVANVNTEIRSGYLEMSNVNIVSEMVNLIAITRQYESNQKVIQAYDESLETTTQLGRLG